VSHDFEVGTNVSCEELTVSPHTGLFYLDASSFMEFYVCKKAFLVSTVGGWRKNDLFACSDPQVWMLWTTLYTDQHCL